MNIRGVLYWSGPLMIAWLWMMETLDHWLQQSWQSRLLEGVATRHFWIGIAGAYFAALALAALATRLVFFLKRRQEGMRFTSLLPHLLLCGVLMGTSVVLEGPGVLSQLSEVKLDFLGRFLFYVAVVWSLVAVLNSLLPLSATQPEKK
jgi:hypothetical protein